MNIKQVNIFRYSMMLLSIMPITPSTYLPHVSNNGSICPRVFSIHPYFTILVDNKSEGFIKPPEKEVQLEDLVF